MQGETSNFAPKTTYDRTITYDRTRASEREILKILKTSGSWLRHKEIIDLLTPRWSKRTVARYLKGMEQKGLIEKRLTKNGLPPSYRVLEAPKEHDTLEYLNDLRERTQATRLVYDWEVSGFISSLAEGMLLGFPEVDGDTTPIEKEIISTFLVRISYAFSALLSVRNVLLWRKLGVKVPLDDDVIRQYILELQARKMNDTRLETRQLLELASDSLCGSRGIISKLISENEKTIPQEHPHLDDFELFELGDAPFEDLVNREQQLRNEGLDIDRFKIGVLLRKWERVQRKIDILEAKQMKRANGKSVITISIPRYYSRREAMLRRALNLKIAEEMKRLGLFELNDFGMVVTANRRALNKYFDTERLVYDAATSTEQFNRKLTIGTEEFAIEVGEMMAAYRRMTEDSLRSLSNRVWFTRYFGNNLESMVRAFQKQKKENEVRRAEEWKEDLMFDDDKLQEFLANSSKLGSS